MEVKVRKLMQNIDSGIQCVSKVVFHKRRLGNVGRHFFFFPSLGVCTFLSPSSNLSPIFRLVCVLLLSFSA